MLVHLQLLCAQRGKELGFSWWVESSGKHIKHLTLQRISIQVLLHLPPLGRNLKGDFRDPNLGDESYGLGSCANQKRTHDFPLPRNT